MLVAGGTDAADIYARATGTQLDEAALDYFRLAWDLTDLAEYLNVLRSPHQEDDDTDVGISGSEGTAPRFGRVGRRCSTNAPSAALYKIQTNSLTISRLG